jgi:hypothetical protein
MSAAKYYYHREEIDGTDAVTTSPIDFFKREHRVSDEEDSVLSNIMDGFGAGELCDSTWESNDPDGFEAKLQADSRFVTNQAFTDWLVKRI